MSYITRAQLTDRYSANVLTKLTDRGTPKTGVIDDDVLNRAITDADALIDAHIAKVYKLPVSAVPMMLVGIAGALTFYKLHIYQADEKATNDYRDALRNLEKIGRREILLDIEGVEPTSAHTSQVYTTDRDRPMSNSNLKGFI